MTKKITGIVDPVPSEKLSVRDILQGIPTPTIQVQRPGIYFLLKGQMVDYVGQTRNLYLRLSKHHRLKRYHKVSFLPVGEQSDLDTMEHYFIRTFQPRLNVKGKL